ncbi:putative selenocysteine-tRNA-specific elongation factor [Trypanosoma rangeli]|uniref:Putative selenocysteine-tRNA-specific elongation factor n=1 Tax=Trypanosoma rangeli TaxID=5698 RepID=A0A3S5IRQ8_TRYRA|nr:putative selenocysteine-tRNA-specific elongation factor [Trypanosoma rangeli]RNF08236.1 putative selenocysteine-tRNA-specific elongation factor [Trypanosoma rangeli]|eukprot:RNF08236.1 putative selenocysteine-tRNA-specific elongation factor [Trypanosoma rangeli]
MQDQVIRANINVGILGHVDSGKTSLAKALSSTASTAAFDKSPESQRRGITLDLGFSACCISTAVAAPPLHAAGIEEIQCTFVDCPGHASLIRTVLGGAQIIDIMILVIDACKGIQTQTAECIVIGEVLCKPLLVVINKIDAVQGSTPADKRATLNKLRKRLEKTFERTRWPSVQMVEVAAAPRGDGVTTGEVAHPINMEEVTSAVLSLVDVAALKDQFETPLRSEDFAMMFDHCFALKGQGTVFTGTVLRGQVSVGDSVLIPDAHLVKKVKGLQAFRRPLQRARRGDRVGLCVVQFDAEGVERGLLCSAQQHRGALPADASPLFESASVLIAEVNRVRFHQLSCDAHTKFHITIGHSTVMGTMRYFSRPTVDTQEEKVNVFDLLQESLYVDELTEDTFLTFGNIEWKPKVGYPVAVKRGPLTYYAIVLLDRPILAAVGTPLIATRLEMERENMCRIAIAGSVCALLNVGGSGAASPMFWRDLPIVRYKSRALVVERVLNEKTCIASGVVGFEAPDTSCGNDNHKTKEKDILHAEVQKFIGMRVHFRPTVDEEADASTLTGIKVGVIDSAFGKTGKVKLVFKEPIFANEPSGAGRAKRSGVAFLTDGVVELTLKKYPLALHSQLQQ